MARPSLGTAEKERLTFREELVRYRLLVKEENVPWQRELIRKEIGSFLGNRGVERESSNYYHLSGAVLLLGKLHYQLNQT